jgi:hypothetical protein
LGNGRKEWPRADRGLCLRLDGLLELGPLDILDARQGPVVLDASGTIDAAFCRPTIWEVGCNMHSRHLAQ